MPSPSTASNLASCSQAETLATAAALHLENARQRRHRTPEAPGVQKALKAAEEAFVAASGEAAAAALQREDFITAEKWLTDALVHIDGVGSATSASLERDCAQALLHLRSFSKLTTSEQQNFRLLGSKVGTQNIGYEKLLLPSTPCSMSGLGKSRSSSLLRPRSANLAQPGTLVSSASAGSLRPTKPSSRRPSSAGPSVSARHAANSALDVWPRNCRQSVPSRSQQTHTKCKRGLPPSGKCPPKVPPLPFSNVVFGSDCKQDCKDLHQDSMEQIMSSSRSSSVASGRLSSMLRKELLLQKVPPLPLTKLSVGTDCKQNYMYMELSTRESSEAPSATGSYQSSSRSTNDKESASLQQQASCPGSSTTAKKTTTMESMQRCKRHNESSKDCFATRDRYVSSNMHDNSTTRATSTAPPPLPPLPPFSPSLPPTSPEPEQITTAVTELVSLSKLVGSVLPLKPPVLHEHYPHPQMSGRAELQVMSGKRAPSRFEKPACVENVPNLRLPSLGGSGSILPKRMSSTGIPPKSHCSEDSVAPRQPPSSMLLKAAEHGAPTAVLMSETSFGQGNFSDFSSIFSDQLTSAQASEILDFDEATKHHAAGQIQRWWRRTAHNWKVCSKEVRPVTLSAVQECATVLQRRFRARQQQLQFARARVAATTIQRWVKSLLLKKQALQHYDHALKIQQWFRRLTSKSKAFQKRVQSASAVQIQRAWRIFRNYHLRSRSAARIQRMWRALQIRRVAQIKQVIQLAGKPRQSMALQLGRKLHAHLARAAAAELQKRADAASVIAWAWGAYATRRKFLRSRAAARVLQRYARIALERRKAAVTLQRYWRGAIVRQLNLTEGILLGSCVKRCGYGPVVHCEVRAWLQGAWSLSGAAVCSRSGGLQKQDIDLQAHRRATPTFVPPAELARRWLQDLSIIWREGRPVLYLPPRPSGSGLQHLPSRSLSRSLSVCSRPASAASSRSMSVCSRDG